MECGAFYPVDKVHFPENHAEIAQVLRQRERRDEQNWTNESVEALQKENEEHL